LTGTLASVARTPRFIGRINVETAIGHRGRFACDRGLDDYDAE
jgi:hypothetical protein